MGGEASSPVTVSSTGAARSARTCPYRQMIRVDSVRCFVVSYPVMPEAAIRQWHHCQLIRSMFNNPARRNSSTTIVTDNHVLSSRRRHWRLCPPYSNHTFLRKPWRESPVVASLVAPNPVVCLPVSTAQLCAGTQLHDQVQPDVPSRVCAHVQCDRR